MSRDWNGNSRSTFSMLGASNHSEYERAEYDYYATEPVAIDMLAQTSFFDNVKTIWEPACGGGHLSERMLAMDLQVISTDKFNHWYRNMSGIKDFLSLPDERCNIDAIVTNPPYKYALEFCERAISLAPKVAMFLKLTFLEGQKRQAFFNAHPPRYVAVCANRVSVARNGNPEAFKKSSAVCYAWFIWGKGYKGNPEILWLKKT